MGDLGDKLEEADKTEITSKIEAVKTALNGTDVEAIKKATEELQNKFYEVSAKLYQQANPQGNAGPDMGGDAGASGDGTYYNADFEDKTNN